MFLFFVGGVSLNNLLCSINVVFQSIEAVGLFVKLLRDGGVLEKEEFIVFVSIIYITLIKIKSIDTRN